MYLDHNNMPSSLSRSKVRKDRMMAKNKKQTAAAHEWETIASLAARMNELVVKERAKDLPYS